MSITVITILFVAGFVLAIVLGEVTKVNPGFLAIGFGFILSWITGQNTNYFISLFPTSLFWSMAIPMIFYGFAINNGTMNTLGKNVAYWFRNARWAMPIAMLVMATLVSASGAGITSTIILAPLCWTFCLQCGFHPFLVPLSLWCASMLGAFVPWTAVGSLNIGMWATFLTDVSPMTMWVKDYIYKLFMGIVPFFVMFFVLKGWKPWSGNTEQKGDFVMAKPEPFNKEQKATMVVIFSCILLLLIPSIINAVAKNPVTTWMINNFTLQATSACGIVALIYLKVADTKKVFSESVPWDLLWTITGVAMYCMLSGGLGIIDAAGTALAGMSGVMVLSIMCLICGLLSFVTSAITVGQLVNALVPALAVATGLPQYTVMLAATVGSGVTSISPYSQGGATSLIGCPPQFAKKMTTWQIICALVFLAVGVLANVTGIIKLI